MGDGLARVLSKPDFDAESFVKKQLNCSVLSNVDELESLRRQVGRLKGETSVALKKNVYRHYSQFIDTAKEISILEGEMYQMSHLLSEQKAIINNVIELSSTEHKEHQMQKEGVVKDEAGDFSSRLSLSYLLERLEGCGSLNKSSGSQLVYDGDVVELDNDSHLPLTTLHLFLLTDSLIIASCLPEIKGTFLYHFEASYDLQSLAVVNVREGPDLTCAFKLLLFPSSRLFAVPSPKIKRKWIEVLEEWKRTCMSTTQAPSSTTPGTNPFDEKEEGGSGMEEWMVDAPEDLDVLVAQRDFEGAVDLVLKVNDYLNKHSNKLPDIDDFRRRLENRVSELTESLKREMSVSAERSVRGGLRGVRKMAHQLLRLKKISLACDLFLSNRSRVCHHVLKQLTNESQALPYVSNLCDCFFSNMAAISEEFKMVFEGHPRCSSAFIQWCQDELTYFCGIFNKQVFESNLSFATTVACVAEAKKGCQKLSTSGVEMLYVLEDLLMPQLLTCIQAAGDTHMEAIKHRAVDDRWKGLKLQTRESLKRFEEEMAETGVRSLAEYRMDDTHTYLTSSTIEFSKCYILLTTHLTTLHSPPLHQCIIEGLKDILFSYATYLFKATSDHDMTLVRMNARFVGREVVTWVVEEFERETGLHLHLLAPIQHTLLEL